MWYAGYLTKMAVDGAGLALSEAKSPMNELGGNLVSRYAREVGPGVGRAMISELIKDVRRAKSSPWPSAIAGGALGGGIGMAGGAGVGTALGGPGGGMLGALLGTLAGGGAGGYIGHGAPGRARERIERAAAGEVFPVTYRPLPEHRVNAMVSGDMKDLLKRVIKAELPDTNI
jgi:hypothetical protein